MAGQEVRLMKKGWIVRLEPYSVNLKVKLR